MSDNDLETARAIVAWFIMLWLPSIVGALVLHEARRDLDLAAKGKAPPRPRDYRFDPPQKSQPATFVRKRSGDRKRK